MGGVNKTNTRIGNTETTIKEESNGLSRLKQANAQKLLCMSSYRCESVHHHHHFFSLSPNLLCPTAHFFIFQSQPTLSINHIKPSEHHDL